MFPQLAIYDGENPFILRVLGVDVDMVMEFYFGWCPMCPTREGTYGRQVCLSWF